MRDLSNHEIARVISTSFSCFSLSIFKSATLPISSSSVYLTSDVNTTSEARRLLLFLLLENIIRRGFHSLHLAGTWLILLSLFDAALTSAHPCRWLSQPPNSLRAKSRFA